MLLLIALFVFTVTQTLGFQEESFIDDYDFLQIYPQTDEVIYFAHVLGDPPYVRYFYSETIGLSPNAMVFHEDALDVVMGFNERIGIYKYMCLFPDGWLDCDVTFQEGHWQSEGDA